MFLNWLSFSFYLFVNMSFNVVKNEFDKTVDEFVHGDKCGEIFVWGRDNFILLCHVCKHKFESMQLFGVHWMENHIAQIIYTNVDTVADIPHDCDSSRDSIYATDDATKSSIDCALTIKANDVEANEVSVMSGLTKRKCTTKKASQISCDKCSKQFKSRMALSYHLKKYDCIPDDFKCKYCNTICSSKTNYIQHANTHSGRKKYICPHCPKRFASDFTRREHVYIHTGERPHKCPHCARGFASKYTLQMHIKMHLNRKEHCCEFCDKCYVRKSDLITHLRSHTGERPYQCEECGKSYTVISKLKEHIKRHSDLRDFKCDVCGKAFFSKYILQQHVVKHSNARPFECKECGSTFPRSKALLLHMKLHSGLKEYVCNICGKAYAQSSGLHGHKKSHGEQLASNKI